MPGFMIAIFIVVVALAIVGAIYSHHAQQKRRQELAAWAAAHGLSFDPGHDSAFDERYPKFDCLRQGSNRYAYNILRGAWRERRLEAFEYHYETYSTDSKGRRQTHHHYFSAAVLTSRVPLEPPFIRPEGFFDKVAEFFGFDDIDFESARFSREFHVKAPDKRWAYDVLHARAMEFLLDQPRYHLSFDRDCVMGYKDGAFKVGEHGQAADVVAGLLDLLPQYVIRQQNERAGHAQGSV